MELVARDLALLSLKRQASYALEVNGIRRLQGRQMKEKSGTMMKYTPKLLIAVALVAAVIGVTWRQTSPLVPNVTSAAEVAIPASYFAMTMNSPLTTPWPTIPFKSLRTWDTGVGWADINISKGVYDWSKLDSIINLAQSRGVELVFTLGRTPQWASSKPTASGPYGPGQCAPPSSLEDWGDFVRAIVTRAAGRIRYWELWNEPQDPQFFCGDIAAMVALQQHAHTIIKSIDPSLMVLTPSPVNALGPQWMSSFLKAGGGQYADIMAFHGYWDTSAESILRVIESFKRVFIANGQASKPMWDTEGGWGQTSQLSNPDLQAAFLAKSYLLRWSRGVSRFYWYSYDNDQWGTLWSRTKGLNRAGIAYKEITRWMTGATMSVPCAEASSPNGSIWTCGFSRAGYEAMAVWKSNGTATFEIPRQFTQLRDLNGETKRIVDVHILVENEPVLLETGSAF